MQYYSMPVNHLGNDVVIHLGIFGGTPAHIKWDNVSKSLCLVDHSISVRQVLSVICGGLT